MRSPATALSWEYWRRGWPGVLLYALAAVSVPALLYGTLSIRLRSDGMAADPGLLGYAGIHPFLFAWVLPFIVFGAYLAAGTPRRRLTLPVSAWTIAGWPMLNGAVAVAGSYLCVATVLDLAFGADWPLVKPVIASVMVFAWCQALLWTVQFLPESLQSVGALVGPALFSGWSVTRHETWEAGEAPTIWSDVSPAEVLGMVLLTGAAYFVSVAGVSLARRGQVLSLVVIARWIASVFDSMLLRRKRFATPAAAQLWLEWREKGLALPIVAACVSLVTAACFAVGAVRGEDWLRLLGGFPILLLYSSPLFGLFYGGCSEGVEFKTFRATRPTADTALADAILKNLALSILAAWAVWLVVTAAASGSVLVAGQGSAILNGWPIGELLARGGWPLALACGAASFAGVSILSWTLAAWGASLGLLRRWLLLTIVAAGFIAPVSGLLVSGYVLPHEWSVVFGRIVYWAMVVAVVAGAIVVYYGAYRLGLITARRVSVVAVLYFPFAVACSAAFVWRMTALEPALLRSTLFSLTAWVPALCATPFVPLAAAPLALWWSRHR